VLKNPGEIFLDLDRNRIKSVLLETYGACKDFLTTDFSITAEQFVSKIDPYLDSNRISIPVTLDLPSRKYPELKIEVNLRRRGVIARLYNRTLRTALNRYLTKL
jgi:hypothetical protein